MLRGINKLRMKTTLRNSEVLSFLSNEERIHIHSFLFCENFSDLAPTSENFYSVKSPSISLCQFYIWFNKHWVLKFHYRDKVHLHYHNEDIRERFFLIPVPELHLCRTTKSFHKCVDSNKFENFSIEKDCYFGRYCYDDDEERQLTEYLFFRTCKENDNRMPIDIFSMHISYKRSYDKSCVFFFKEATIYDIVKR